MSQTSLAIERNGGLAEALHYHDPERFGFISVLVLDTQSSNGWSGRQRSFPLSQMAKELPDFERTAGGVYIGINEFTKPNRQAVNLERLTSCYLDLDTYKVQRLAGAQPEFLRDEVLLACQQRELPPPSLMVFSGHGVQVKWIFPKPIPAAALPRWQAVQENLFACFEDLGADRRALDCSRVLRLVGSTHQGTGEVVRVIHRTVTPTMGGETTPQGVVGYTLDVLAEAALRKSRHDIEVARFEMTQVIKAQRKKTRKASSARIKAKKEAAAKSETYDEGTHPAEKRKANAGSRPLDLFELAWRRIADLRKLLGLRGWTNGAPAKQRNAFVFTAAICLSFCVPSEQLLDNLYELAREFAPTWSQAEVRSCAQSVIARAKQVPGFSLSGYASAHDDPRYTPKSAWLAEFLAVTATEARSMTSIFGPDERRRRDREAKAKKRRAAGCLTRVAYCQRAADRVTLACRLRAEGLDASTVAARLGVRKRSVYAYWKHAEAPG